MGISTRLETKPGKSLTRMGVLPTEVASAVAVSTVSGEVSRPGTTSTSFITGTGLKKCRPTNCAGRLVCAASLVMEIDDVLLAKITSGRAMRFERAEDFGFRLEVLDHRLDDEIRIRERPRGRSWSSAARAPARAPPPSSGPFRRRGQGPSRSSPRRDRETAGPRHCRITEYPLLTRTWAIPSPMVPAPTTPTVLIVSFFH